MYKRVYIYVFLFLSLLIGGCNIFTVPEQPSYSPTPTHTVLPQGGGEKLEPPPFGIYHGAFPAFGPTEDVVTRSAVLDFERLVGKKIVWGYFSNNWYNGIVFPKNAVETLHSLGVVPFIRLMPRSSLDTYIEEDEFTLDRIIRGDFDKELRKWAQDARDSGIPLLLEFGTEVNGDWFPWCGAPNGGGQTDGYGDPTYPDGPERFKDAYRHIYDIFQEEGANNITWFIHYIAYPWPEVWWNKMSYYYPGDDYVDWIGVSVYGPLTPYERWIEFPDIMSDIYDELTSISPGKPVAILEWGVTNNHPFGDKAEWIRNALTSLINGDWPSVKAISYWHSSWEEDDGTITNLRLDSSPDVLEAYRSLIKNEIFIDTPIFY